MSLTINSDLQSISEWGTRNLVKFNTSKTAFNYLCFKNTVNLFIHIARNPDRRFSSSTSQHFKMSPPFASSEGVSASDDRLQSDGVQDTHLLPHS